MGKEQADIDIGGQSYSHIGQYFFPSPRTNDGIPMHPHALSTPDNGWIEYAVPVDKVASDKLALRKASDAFFSEWSSESGFSPATKRAVFKILTGFEPPQRDTIFRRKSDFSPQAAYASVSVLKPSTVVKKEKSVFQLKGDIEPGMMDHWPPPPPEAYLGQLIRLAKKDPKHPLKKTVMGGGLLPEETLFDFWDLLTSDVFDEIRSWQPRNKLVDRERVLDSLQYARDGAGGAPSLHEKIVRYYLSHQDARRIEKVHGKKNSIDAVWMMNGSQDVLHSMLKTMVEYRRDKHKPAVVAVTESTYAGVLMAAQEMMERNELKFRIVKQDEDGTIDLDDLDQALSTGNCDSFYTSEGNPLPLPIGNKKEIANMIRKKHKNIMVWEDRAYRDLGLDDNNTFGRFLPDQTVTIETTSKKLAPGMRLGIVHTAIRKDKCKRLRQAMLGPDYNQTLGLPGMTQMIMAGLMMVDEKTGKFRRHVESVARNYEKRRKIYAQTYEEMLKIAYGDKFTKLTDYVLIGAGMFGYRKAPVDSVKYSDAGVEIGVFSLPGTECIPAKKYSAGPNPEKSKYTRFLRQNYSFETPTALKIGIAKDVALQVLFDKSISGDSKELILRELLGKAEQFGGEKRPEFADVIRKAKTSGWTWPAA
ncbi:hypothetical protein M1271_00780 [Patescibacteria group bacterium]|nr:hypothetical protein [Patescibacteria group bacterium]MCL5797553.1 hypothetical protein [Patescibacteria group bacterium]